MQNIEMVSEILGPILSNAVIDIISEAFNFIFAHILGFIIFTLIIFFIFYLQSSGIMKFSSGVNEGMGSLFYRMFFILIFIVLYFVFGTDVIDEMIFWIIYFVSYKLTGVFLREIGFWT